jgi:hypothetical protein
VAWVFADNTDNAFAADHTAKFAEGFNGGTDAHTRIIKKVSLGELKTPLWRRGA